MVPRCWTEGSPRRPAVKARMPQCSWTSGVVVHVAVARQGADGEVVALVADVAAGRRAAQVDQDRGCGEAQPHQRDQGVPAGEELGLVAVLAQKLYGVVDRFGDLVVEGHRVHYASPPFLRGLDGAPTPASGEAGMSMCVIPKGARGVDDRVYDRRRGAYGPGLAYALDAHRVGGRGRHGPVQGVVAAARGRRGSCSPPCEPVTRCPSSS